MTATVSSSSSSSSSVATLEALVRDRDETISRLERVRTQQELSLIAARNELHEARVRRREETHRARLEKDLRAESLREADARVAALERELASSSAPDVPLPKNIDRAHVARLHAHLTRSLRVIAALDGQIVVVKSSCDRVVASLKEELSEAAEERSRAELELLNQLAAIDNARKISEKDLTLRLRSREEEVEDLRRRLDEQRRGGGDGSSSSKKNDENASDGQRAGEKTENEENKTTSNSTDSTPTTNDDDEQKRIEYDKLKRRLVDLEKERIESEIELKQKLQTAEERTFYLENETSEKSKRIDALEKELAEQKNRTAWESEDVLRRVREDAEEAASQLERLEAASAVVEESTRRLEEFETRRRAADDAVLDDDDAVVVAPSSSDVARDDALAAVVDRAELLCEQTRLSRFLVELKLRNQTAATGEDGRAWPEFARRALRRRPSAARDRAARDVRDNAVELVRRTEEEARARLDELRRDVDGRVRALETALAEKTSEAARLERAAATLRADATTRTTSAQDEAATAVVSASVMNRLQDEIFSAVDRLKEKNVTIAELTSAVEECKVREEVLRREVRRLKKKVRAVEGEDILNALEDGTLGGSRRKLMG